LLVKYFLLFIKANSVFPHWDKAIWQSCMENSFQKFLPFLFFFCCEREWSLKSLFHACPQSDLIPQFAPVLFLRHSGDTASRLVFRPCFRALLPGPRDLLTAVICKGTSFSEKKGEPSFPPPSCPWTPSPIPPFALPRGFPDSPLRFKNSSYTFSSSLFPIPRCSPDKLPLQAFLNPIGPPFPVNK